MPPYVVLRVCITLSRALKSIGIGLLYPLGVKDIFPGLYYVLCCSLIWHVSIGLLSVDTHLYCVFSGWRNQATNLVVILICFWIGYPRLFRPAVRFRVLHIFDLDFAKLHQEHRFICPVFLLITYFDTLNCWLPYHIHILHVSVIFHTMYN